MIIGVNTIHMVPGGGEEDTFLRYALKALREIEPDWSFVLFTDPLNHDSFDGWDRICITQAVSESRFSSLEHAMRRAVTEAAVDKLLSHPISAPQKTPVPLVLFVMELDLLDPGAAALRGWTDVRVKDLRKMASRSAAFVAPTDWARRKLLESLSVPMERIVVSHPGADHVSSDSMPSPVDGQFLLLITQGHGHPYAQTFIRAYERLVDSIPFNLIAVGELECAEPIVEPGRFLHIHQAPLAQQAALYQHCELALCPAGENATGLAALETLRAGARVIAAKTGSIPEVARNAPFYCELSSVSAVAAAILHALDESDSQKRHRITAGIQAAMERTWKECAIRLAIALRR